MNLKIDWGGDSLVDMEKLSSEMAHVRNDVLGFVRAIKRTADNHEEGLLIYVPMDIAVAEKTIRCAENRFRLAAFDHVLFEQDIPHGNDLRGKHYLAVIEGNLCNEGECDWCDDLRKRIINYRAF